MNFTEEQIKAITLDGTNILLSAGAGSGKTAVLTERVIEKLKKGVHIDELLLLTFTNNASLEMMDRIKKKIEEVDYLKDEALKVDSSYITTFDGFFLRLVKKYYYVLNLPSKIDITDEGIIKMIKIDILDEIFNEFYEKNDKDFIDLVLTFNVKNDVPLRKKIIYLDNQLSLLSFKEDYLNNYIDYFYNETNINNFFNKYMDILNDKIKAIENLLHKLSFIDSNYYEKIKTVLNPLLSSKTYDDIKNNISVTIPRLPNNSLEDLKNIKTSINKKVSEISTLSSLSYEELINDYKSTEKYSKVLINILKELDKRVKDYKDKNNIYSFNDISKLAIKLVKEHDDIKQQIKLKFKEIMIDEYQDTSDIQEEFINLICNNNCYMVGDIKQSIYRFRNANPNIFKIKYDKYKNNDGGIKIDLNKNFRSRYEVLDSINNIFDHIMDMKLGNARYKEEHRLIFGNNSFIENGKTSNNNNLEIYNYKKDDNYSLEEIESFIIASDIKDKVNNHYKVFDKNKLRDITYKDFCILMDRTSTFDTYKKVFDYLNIPLNVYKDNDITSFDEVILINNILSFILDIKRKNYEKIKFYYTSIARSYLYNLEDDYIFKQIKNNKIFDDIIYKNCYEISKMIDYLDNRSIILEILDKFSFYERIKTTYNIKNRLSIINNILDIAKNINNINGDIYMINKYFNYLIDNGEKLVTKEFISDTDSVTITNIHKSKGLEYKICYYSGFYKEFNMMEYNERICFDKDFGIILPAFYNGFRNTFVNVLYKEKNINEEIGEKLRLFYVALTRSKEKMIILNSMDIKDIISYDKENVVDYDIRIKYKSFKDIIDSVFDYVSCYIKNIDVPNINLNYRFQKDYDLERIKNGNIINVNDNVINYDTIKKEHFSKEQHKIITKKESLDINYGKLMHKVLEDIDFKCPNLESLDEFSKSIVLGLLNNNIMKDLKDTTIYKEYEFFDNDNDTYYHGIIDLMIEHDTFIDIVDYKLRNINDEAYIKQLNGYKNYISKKTNKKINIYLYSLTNKTLTKII